MWTSIIKVLITDAGGLSPGNNSNTNNNNKHTHTHTHTYIYVCMSAMFQVLFFF